MEANTVAIKEVILNREFESLIFELRGFKVMIDADLAALYETETKRLKEQVKRNPDRFPDDFMFQLTSEEKEQLVANCDRLANLKHSSINPLAFTEQGVAMLSSVLKSPKAVKINIEIIRAFVYYRRILLQHSELNRKIKAVDEKIDKVFRYLLDKIDSKKAAIMEPIGYKINKK